MRRGAAVKRKPDRVKSAGELAQETEFWRRRNLVGVEIRRMFGTRYTTIEVHLLSRTIATCTELITRGKTVQVSYLLPPID
jgi:hypothetical protein